MHPSGTYFQNWRVLSSQCSTYLSIFTISHLLQFAIRFIDTLHRVIDKTPVFEENEPKGPFHRGLRID